MQTIVQHDGDQLFTTSEIIAERAEVEHRSVLQIIGNYEQDLAEFGTIAFEMRKSGGRPTRVAKLNEQQSTLVLTYLRNTPIVRTFKKDLVKAFYEMAKQLQQPMSDEDIVGRALEIQTNKVKALETKVELDAPKVTYVDEFVADNDYLLFRTVASNLGIGEHALRWALVYSGWIYHDSYRRRNSKGEVVTEHQWAEYSHKKGYFYRSMNHEAPLFKGNTKFTLKITPTGASAITRLIKKITEQFGSVAEALPELEARYNQRRRGAA